MENEICEKVKTAICEAIEDVTGLMAAASDNVLAQKEYNEAITCLINARLHLNEAYYA